jgi:hypothetical protein
VALPDRPLGFHWRPLRPEQLEPLGLPRPSNRREAATQAAIVTEAFLVARADPTAWISYSRAKTFYQQADRYRGTAYGYAPVIHTADHLERVGLIDHDKAHPGRFGVQSTLRATPRLVSALSASPFPVVFNPAEILVLRNRDKTRLDYPETATTRGLRGRLESINEGLRGVTVAHPDLGVVRDGDPVRLGRANPGPARRTLNRTFTEDFDHHGRFYGGWWQNSPKAERSRLRIDGEPVYEADYPRLHVTLAYAQAGVRLVGDPYDVPPWPVPTVKVAVNIVLNAANRTSALRALAQHIGGAGSFNAARDVLSAVEARHAPIAALFYSDAGMRLMNLDSGMAEGVLLALIRRGLVALPNHDSFIVQEGQREHLLEAMADQLERVTDSGVSVCAVEGISEIDLHKGPRASSLPFSGPLVVVVLPVSPQCDLFGDPVPVVSSSALFGGPAVLLLLR